MSEPASMDPLALMRAAVDQWEKLSNEYGAQFLQRPQTSEAMQKMTGGFLQMQKMTQDALGKALAAANLPSRHDIEALSSRLRSIETSLARIEAAAVGASLPRITPIERPPRTRQPTPRS